MDNESHVLVSAAGPKEIARLIQVWIGTELLMVHVIRSYLGSLGDQTRKAHRSPGLLNKRSRWGTRHRGLELLFVFATPTIVGSGRYLAVAGAV